MQMVDIRNSGNSEKLIFYSLYINAFRYPVEIHTNTLFQKIHDARDHDDGDYNGNDRIDYGISGEIDDSSSNHNPERYERIGEKMEVCGFYVYIFLVAPHQKPSGKPVYKDPYPGYRHHG